MKVLILSSQSDYHSVEVAEHIGKLGGHADYLSFDQIDGSSFDLRITDKFEGTIKKKDTGRLDLTDYYSVWHRRPGVLSTDRFAEPWIEGMVNKEMYAALDGALQNIDCLWVNSPERDRAASSKLRQLDIARQVGLSIPSTIVTSEPQVVREFYEECHGKVIYKLLSDQSSFSIPRCETPCGIPTSPLHEEDLPHLDQVVHAPHFFQQAIEKRIELRVTVVGNEIFSLSIDSQTGKGTVDWRLDYEVEMKQIVLPDEIKSKCLAMMKRLGLNYGAFDFIVTPEMDYVFVEVNPQGQYLWAELRCEMPISLEIAKLLTGNAPALVPNLASTV